MTADEQRDPVAAALDDAACGLVRTRDDGTFLRANRLFCRWVGRDADELVGRRRFQDLLTMGGRLFHQTHWSPLLRMQGSVSEVKLEVVHADGSRIPVVVNALRHQRDGEVVHDLAVLVARDRDRYEQELVRSRQRLEELVAETRRLHAEARDRAEFAEQMIGIVSHDLRNPLSAIVMGTELLQRGDLDPTRQRVVDRISSATERATRLILDLLDFTRARLGSGLSVSPAPVDLHAAVADAVDELRLAYPARTLEHERVDGGEAGCQADVHRLAQLVGNLVSNAVAYGQRDAPITVTSLTDASQCAITVHNAGDPIPLELQPRLFQPMTRGAQAGGRARSVGLGLYIVREIMRAHGGDVSVTSTPDTGTTFRATFPRHP